MQKIKQILNDLLNTGSISLDDYNYLQNHKQDTIKTGNLEFIELTDTNKPNYKFTKVL